MSRDGIGGRLNPEELPVGLAADRVVGDNSRHTCGNHTEIVSTYRP
jgi:hypothetical protein